MGRKTELNWESGRDYSPENEREGWFISLNDTVYEFSEKDYERILNLMKIKKEKIREDDSEKRHKKMCKLVRELGKPILNLEMSLRDDWL